MKLYKADTSPSARAVMMAIDILNIPTEIIDVNTKDGENLTPEYLEMNPLHTIPVIVDGDITVTDSHAIIMYLSDVYGKDDSLYPKDIRQRTLVNQRLFFHIGTLFYRLRDVFFCIGRDGAEKMTERQYADIVEAYGFMEKFLTRSEFLAGDHVTIADIVSLATVTSLLHFVPLDKKRYTKLSDWIIYMEEQPYAKKYNKPGVDLLGQKIKEMMA